VQVDLEHPHDQLPARRGDALSVRFSGSLLREVVGGAERLRRLVDPFGQDRLLQGHDVGLQRLETAPELVKPTGPVACMPHVFEVATRMAPCCPTRTL
jgi:hypothetical protein